MRRLVPAVIAAALCAVGALATPAAALELKTTIDLDYNYTQVDVGGDVNAETLYNQKYEVKYGTSLTTAYDFLGAVRLDLQDAWYTDAASTSRVAPTLELQAKGSQLATKLAYETVISSIDAYRESGDVTSYSTSLAFDLEATPRYWPETKLRYQRKIDSQEAAKEAASSTYEFSARKDIYDLRLEYNFKREDIDEQLPARKGSAENQWSAKATYKNVLWGGTEFELAYEIKEAYKDTNTRGVFTGETSTYSQILKARVKNSLIIAPRLALGLLWEYQFEQDLLALEFDYKLKNKYALDLRWDALDWLKFNGEARRETDMLAAVEGEEDERASVDSLKAGFAMTSISWLQVSGKAEFKSDSKIAAFKGGSVDKVDESKYELIVKNRIGDFWDLTVNASTATKQTDDELTNRETKVRTELKLKLLELVVTPGFEVNRTNEWARYFEFPVGQEQIRDGNIKFEYQLQLADMIKATFAHEYGIKVDDKLDEVLNFERVLQFREDTRLTIVLTEIVRDLKVEGEIDRKASDTEEDTDPELVEISYALKLDWRLDRLTVLSSIKYNDKGDTFDDVSFNAKASWKGDRLELTGEYQFDKIIKDITEPKDEKRKLSLKLNYKF